MNGVVNDVLSGCIMLAIGLVVEMIRRSVKKNNTELKDMIKNSNKIAEDNRQESQENFNLMRLEIARVRILTLIYDDPTSHNEILDLFDQYEKMGGNGSTKQRVHDWKQREGID